MKNKKGISAIVATVLIILITVAAVTIIWAAIIPMISNQLDKGTICLDAVSQVQLVDAGYTCKGTDNVSLQIKHGASAFDLADIQVLISAGGTTTSYTIMDNATGTPVLPGSNEERVFKLVNNSKGVTFVSMDDIDSVSIAPIVGVGNTQEACDVSATKALRDC